jgi:hypothetical protein
MIKTSKDSLFLQIHLVFLALLGLLSLWLGYQLYSFAYQGLDMFPLLIIAGLSGILTLGIELHMFGKAWQTYIEHNLTVRTAKVVYTWPIFVNNLVVTIGTICSFAGGLAAPQAEPSSLGDFVIGLAVMLLLFYPFHLIGVALSIGAWFFVSKSLVIDLDGVTAQPDGTAQV